MEMVRMITDLDERMRQWRRGELSDSEILGHLFTA